MVETGLLEAIIPELGPLRGCGQGEYHHLDVLDHTLLAFDCLEAFISDPAAVLPEWAPDIRDYLAQDRHGPLLKLAVLLHDLGKPASRVQGEDGLHFIGHEETGAEAARDIAARLRLSVMETDMLAHIIRHHLRIILLMASHRQGNLTRRGIYRLSRDVGPHLRGLVLHTLADASATRGPLADQRGGMQGLLEFLEHLLRELKQQEEVLAKRPALLTGRDLMAEFHIKPSPLFGRLLADLEQARALGEITDRREALDFIRKRLEIWGSAPNPV